ncbi:hypothetical protein [Williamsia deligens]|uniref:Uncharacterized protein n=1 Tax=Williamsia deligens TaxID=321325 RepID=A0ABW3GFJ4_9NOCA|nr:hypothetical protein [Williamsia deligens]MCP2196049.1 hypothetical protein [Williamsia deligens]
MNGTDSAASGLAVLVSIGRIVIESGEHPVNDVRCFGDMTAGFP